MGPDCGTAIIDGVPLGFANVVRRGAIGVVGASGTGLQQVTCLVIAAAQASRRRSAPAATICTATVGGITMLQGLERARGATRRRR